MCSFHIIKMQVLSEPGVCNTPTQKLVVTEEPRVRPAQFAFSYGGKGGQH